MDTRTQPQEQSGVRARPWRRALLAIVLTLAFLGGGLFWLNEREPTCRGKRLSEWLELYATVELFANAGEHDDTKTAEGAIRQIGTNGLPCLVRWIRYEPSSRKGTMRKLVEKLPPRIRSNRFFYPLMEDRAARRAMQAEMGLAILGPEAAPAVPDLTRLMKRYTGTNTSLSAIRSLGCIGSAGLPSLLAAAADPQFPNRFAAISTIAMNFRGTNGIASVPVLLVCANDPDARVARASLLALGTMKLAPETILPVLTNHVHDSRPDLRVAAVYSLGAFKTQAAQLVPVLREVIERDSDPHVRLEAVAVAGKFKEQTPEMVLLLNGATKDSDQNVREAANDALRTSRDSARYAD